MDRYAQLAHDTGPLTPGVIDDAAIEAYTNGGCWYLAWWLHELTGYPIAVIGGYDPDLDYIDDSSPWHGYSWVHVGVTTPEGLFLDINGPADMNDAMEQYLIYEDVYTEEQCLQELPADQFVSVISFDPDLVDEKTATLTESLAHAVLVAHHIPAAT